MGLLRLRLVGRLLGLLKWSLGKLEKLFSFGFLFKV